MPFYTPQTVIPEKQLLCFLPEIPAPRGDLGQFLVHVEGETKEFTVGFELVRANFFGGLKIYSMGWTGPIGNKLQKYENNGISTSRKWPRQRAP